MVERVMDLGKGGGLAGRFHIIMGDFGLHLPRMVMGMYMGIPLVGLPKYKHNDITVACKRWVRSYGIWTLRDFWETGVPAVTEQGEAGRMYWYDAEDKSREGRPKYSIGFAHM